MHKGWSRQLRRCLGITDEGSLADWLEAVREQLGEHPAAGLRELFTRVEDSYQQFDRDLALRTRSLELSSDELLGANQRLDGELRDRERAMDRLRATVATLQASLGWEGGARDDDDLDHLIEMLTGMVAYRDAMEREMSAAQRALEYQKFALDQHAIVSIADVNGNILYANDKFCAISGYTREELLGRNHRIVKSGYHPPEFFTEMWRVISSGQVWQGEISNRAKDGSIYWVSATIVPFLDERGRPYQYAGIRTNITQLKRIQDQMEEQLHFVRELMEAIPLPTYFKDTGGRYLGMNRAFEQMFGCERAQLIGQTNARLLEPEDAEFHRAKDAELLAGRAPQSYLRPMDIAERQGRRTLLFQKAPLTRADGKLRGLVGVILDVTEREEAAQAALRAKEAAEAANRAKSDFLANMSHEIRTPMNGVIGMTELLLDTSLTEEQRDYLRVVKSSAEALLTIINDVLDFSKIEAGRMNMEQTSFSLSKLVGDTLRGLALPAHSKGLELICQIDPRIPDWRIGDPVRLRQVLTNLVSNSIKFTPHGEVMLSVAPEASAAGDARLEFKVRDTGIGIAADQLEHVFEAFAQGDSSTTRKYGGTGLGLTISSHLVRMMGGQLRAESQPGQGSSFHFLAHLPIGAAQPTQTAPPRVSLANLSVLVVDDNAVNRRVLVETLNNWGMRTRSVEGGAQAVAAVVSAHPPFDLILLDALMPGMDGLQTASALAALDLPRRPQVMVLSSAGPRDPMNTWRSLGVSAYLPKPILQAELLVALRNLMGPAVAHPAQPDPAQIWERGELAPLDILLVEDHPVNQTLALTLLGKWGHRTLVAANGQEALERLAEQSFDLILMDVQMPVMDGLEATGRIRAGERGRHTPIIAMTANAMEGDRDTCLSAGMDDYLAKPIKIAELHALLARYHPARAPSPAPRRFDYAGALEDMDEEMVDVVAALFLEEFPKDIAALRTAAAAQDFPEFRRVAHSIKSNCGIFGAQPMVELALALEQIDPIAGWNDAAEGIGHLELEFGGLAQALEDRPRSG